MKRNINLVKLSRDHHFGLLCCWKIRQGLSKNIPYSRIRNFIVFFWKDHLEDHFETEDRILPSAGDQGLQLQMDNEHREIRKLMNSISQCEDVKLLSDFEEALQRHIRFEERVYFPNLESALSDGQMNEIGSQLNRMPAKQEIKYADEFWL